MGFNYIFGPVPSRRLGFSLGIGVIPRKYCTFDCIYCEVGRTTNKTDKRELFFNPDEIIRECEFFLKNHKRNLDVITFSGMGEPTLYKGLGYVAGAIKKITDKPLALLTNSSLLWRDDVIDDIKDLDIILPSLDTCVDSTFQRINRPISTISLEMIKKGLLTLKKHFKGRIFLEILFVKGINDTPHELRLLKNFIDTLLPDKIHINTVYRPPPEEGVFPITKSKIIEIKDFFGEKAEPCDSFKRVLDLGVKDTIIKALGVRPMTLEDLSSLTGLKPWELVEMLDEMVKGGKLRKEFHGNKEFYRLS